MKKAILAGLFLAISGVAMAAEFSGNPDRFPSIGLNYSGYAADGTADVKSSGLVASQDYTTTSGNLMLDARVPVSNNLTFNGGIGIHGSSTEADETALLTGQESSAGGVSFNIGIRYYIH